MRVYKKHSATEVEIRIYLTPQEAPILVRQIGMLLPMTRTNGALFKDFVQSMIRALLP